ncbi:putative F-box domain, leucine-rich repeat domain superfamily, F-box-like domain superfamily [Helianthus annuus]|uniref:F-box domain, leucine-rich repeat domain superfamily, F-box-like domain superfamily n=1 Tax=Helianthus annuus TaxID=4232 RepID=A0A251RZ97_HELAN|nr:putative F-box domain, leucine-rich repeat domain superfamily, F-box-like domain superfamily [Helianthus annuus]KAJ0501292.1 putative F-box domain, leucine-rich repeat domain superfamily, F-box-like domain superfamily [Helianthus annuus]KAJ0517200.1 putative F-box domain, leucine-rich repeat domain superfamily, F-box-like domain superfamily [Helianthus annuus]KAJ0685209.1 putative F-box domain, leucine-rich repeat domain superfamily, F-box-like domain superfamily [Helianthus annuus]KAJ068911
MRNMSKARMNVEDDRLSMLPDDLIYRILSHISIKYAIQTAALSSRWRFLWTSMPYLTISTLDAPDLSEFVNHVLSRRNDQIEVYSVNLSFHQQFSKELLKTILDYAFSHNVQKLTVACFLNGHIVFPLDLFRSRSLKYLRLSGSPAGPGNGNCIIFESTWELPALTTLRLDYILVDDKLHGISLFSKCAALKNLTINFFAVLESCNFTVCHSGLSNLTLENGWFTLNFVNVVAPQLKNLTLRSCYIEHMITAPNLVSLLFQSAHLLQFSTELRSLEKVDLRVYFADLWSGSRIAGLLQQLHNVKFLTLNLELVEVHWNFEHGKRFIKIDK